MKRICFTLGLIMVIFIPYYSCQAQTENKSEDQVADELALQLNLPNENLKIEWTKVVDIYTKRCDVAEELIVIINKKLNRATVETKELAKILNEYKLVKKSDEILLNKELFNVFTTKIDDISNKIWKVMMLAIKNKIKTKSFIDIQMKIEGIENQISVERRKYNEMVQSYNIIINTNANNLFLKKYLNLGIKCYFLAQAGSEKAPEVKF